jgi:hypothetical protein
MWTGGLCGVRGGTALFIEVGFGRRAEEFHIIQPP